MADNFLCSITDCGKPHKARGWCNEHYKRWQRNGDPLGKPTWKCQQFLFETIIPYEGNDCLQWPYAADPNGYGRVGYNGKTHVVSRLVCELVNGPSPTRDHEAAHSCGKGNEGCVNPNHLSWKTPIENQADRLAHGTHNRGERQGQSKLTEKDVREIRRLKGVKTVRKIAAEFSISYGTVSAIQLRKCWSWLPD